MMQKLLPVLSPDECLELEDEEQAIREVELVLDIKERCRFGSFPLEGVRRRKGDSVEMGDDRVVSDVMWKQREKVAAIRSGLRL